MFIVISEQISCDTVIFIKDGRNMKKSKRSLKVIEQSGYRYKPTPTLTLKGAWLEEWGFVANLPVTVQCEDGKLVITPKEEESYIDIFEENQLVGAIAKERGRY